MFVVGPGEDGDKVRLVVVGLADLEREPVSRFRVLHCEERVPGQYELKRVFHGA